MLLVLLVCALSAGTTNCAKGVKPDSSISALEANDYTALIEGCGTQLSDGFIVCRKTEGDASQDQIAFVAPPAKCKAESCVSFEIFFPDGSPSFGAVIPNGQTRYAVPWEKLLKKATFDVGDRGFWGFVYTIQFTNDQGIEQTTKTQGEIYMRVMRKGYISLHEIESDPAFVWDWVENGTPVRVTTAGRTYVGKR